MKRLSAHVRSNVVAYLALFVALGGTSYAAFSLPAGSVGTQQLRNGAVTSRKIANGSITPTKIDLGSIGGTIKHWAHVSQSGRVIEREPRGPRLRYGRRIHRELGRRVLFSVRGSDLACCRSGDRAHRDQRGSRHQRSGSGTGEDPRLRVDIQP